MKTRVYKKSSEVQELREMIATLSAKLSHLETDQKILPSKSKKKKIKQATKMADVQTSYRIFGVDGNPNLEIKNYKLSPTVLQEFFNQGWKWSRQNKRFYVSTFLKTDQRVNAVEFAKNYLDRKLV